MKSPSLIAKMALTHVKKSMVSSELAAGSDIPGNVSQRDVQDDDSGSQIVERVRDGNVDAGMPKERVGRMPLIVKIDF